MADDPDLSPLVRWLARLAVEDYLGELAAAESEHTEHRAGAAPGADSPRPPGSARRTDEAA